MRAYEENFPFPPQTLYFPIPEDCESPASYSTDSLPQNFEALDYQPRHHSIRSLRSSGAGPYYHHPFRRTESYIRIVPPEPAPTKRKRYYAALRELEAATMRAPSPDNASPISTSPSPLSIHNNYSSPAIETHRATPSTGTTDSNTRSMSTSSLSTAASKPVAAVSPPSLPSSTTSTSTTRSRSILGSIFGSQFHKEKRDSGSARSVLRRRTTRFGRFGRSGKAPEE